MNNYSLSENNQVNPHSIEQILNQKLDYLNIKVKVSIKNNCLQIMVEGVKIPERKLIVESIKKSFEQFATQTPYVVKICGKKMGDDIPDWVEEFNKDVLKNNTINLASQGNIESITTFINQELKPYNVKAKIKIQQESLQILLEAIETPHQETMTNLLESKVIQLQIKGINKLKLYGKELGDDFPDWQKEITIIAHSEIVPSNNSLSCKELCGISISNQIYELTQEICYQHLIYKINSEDEKTVHQIVEDFIDGLEMDLNSDLKLFSKEVEKLFNSIDFNFNSIQINKAIFDVYELNYIKVREAIKDLDRVSREVLQYDFPEDANFVQAFFSGAWQEVSANLQGYTTMAGQALIGGVVGDIIFPGIGGFIGSAVGGWMAGENKQKVIEEIIERYHNARLKLLDSWEYVIRNIYKELTNLIATEKRIELLNYETLDKADNLYREGNNLLQSIESEDTIYQAIKLYDQSIEINPACAIVWNNKGFALNLLEKYNEALIIIDKAIKIDPNLVMAYNNYGDVLQNLNRHQDAISFYENALKLDTTDYEAYWGVFCCLYELQKYTKAIEICQKLKDIDSEHFLGWYGEARCHSMIGNEKQALENFRQAIKLNMEASQYLVRINDDFKQFRDNNNFNILIESSVEINYASLKKYLGEKEWKKADKETAILIKKIIQKVTNSSDVNAENIEQLPTLDIQTINSLWLESSNGKFGFSVQKEIFGRFQDRNKFGERVGWRIKDSDGNYLWSQNDNFNYRNIDNAPKGNLPSSLWAGEDGWFENRRDRLIALFNIINDDK